jgi:hypothetical protein
MKKLLSLGEQIRKDKQNLIKGGIDPLASPVKPSSPRATLLSSPLASPPLLVASPPATAG